MIHTVTGPDEYTTVVDNNLFTNLMAAENLRLAADYVEQVHAESQPDYRRLVERTGVTDDEVTAWRRAAELIYVPYLPAAKRQSGDRLALRPGVHRLGGIPRLVRRPLPDP